MRPLAEQDHYEVLEVPRDASFEDVERAYRVAQVTYAEGSVALYSVFGGEDAQALRDRIELAWSVLSDVERRCAYDTLLGADDARPSAAPVALRERFPDGGFDQAPPPIAIEPDTPIVPRVAVERPPLPAARAPLRPLAALPPEPPDAHGEGSGGELDGAALRRVRQRRGLDLEQIASVTKINPMYLRCLEDERFDDLPAPVYVRGFLVSYLRCCGIDPISAVPSFMARYEAARAGRRNRDSGRVPGRE